MKDFPHLVAQKTFIPYPIVVLRSRPKDLLLPLLMTGNNRQQDCGKISMNRFQQEEDELIYNSRPIIIDPN